MPFPMNELSARQAHDELAKRANLNRPKADWSDAAKAVKVASDRAVALNTEAVRYDVAHGERGAILAGPYMAW
jgi:hypothetical protein